MKRRIANWIEGFVEYTDILPSDELLRKWTAISIIAGVLERKVWAVSLGRPLYPNFYILLVAPPGIGKTVLINEAQSFWGEIKEMHTGASSLTKAAFIDELAEAERNVTRLNMTPSVISYHALSLASNELAVLLPGYDNEFMNVLTDLYDCKSYDEKRRSNKLSIEIPRPFFNLIAGTTPAFLADLLPESAWDQGFMSRVLMVYSGVQKPINLFDLPEQNKSLRSALAADLRSISKLSGELTYTPGAKKAITDWYDGGLYRQAGKPEHPKLTNYNTRRHMHMLKLCQVLSVVSTSDLQITESHALEAISTIIELEQSIPEIFKAMSSGGDFAVIDGAWYFAYKLFIEHKQAPIRKSLLIQYLQQRVPAHSVERILHIMTEGGMLKKVHVNKIGDAFIPHKYEKL